MTRCHACFENPSFVIKLPSCTCKFCSECLTQWVLSQISEIHFAWSQTVNCLSAACKKPFDPSKILNLLDNNQRKRINDALLKVYMKNCRDIRMCPDSKCFYGGVIDTRMSCSEPLRCEKCGQKWKDEIHLTWWEAKSRMVNQWRSNTFLMKSSVWVEVWTNSCPKCNTPISKNGGCKHMTCAACRYEFCWWCKGPHHGHDTVRCEMSNFLKFWLFVFGIFHLLVNIGIMSIIIRIAAPIAKPVARLAFFEGIVCLPLVFAKIMLDFKNTTSSPLVWMFSTTAVTLIEVFVFRCWNLTEEVLGSAIWQLYGFLVVLLILFFVWIYKCVGLRVKRLLSSGKGKKCSKTNYKEIFDDMTF